MKISIITATYNSSPLLKSAIQSVNNQTYLDKEHIFIDGLSTDNTVEIIRAHSLIEKIIISENDNGIYDALNKGISQATGDIIGFLHSDDFLANQNVIENIADIFSKQDDLDIVYGDLDYISKHDTNKVIRSWKSGSYEKQKFQKGWMPPHPSFYMKKSSYDKFGYFNLDYKISADYDSLLRYMWCNEQKIKYLPEVLVKMRCGGESNRNLGKIFQKSIEDYKILKSHGLPPFKTLLFKNLSKIPQFF